MECVEVKALKASFSQEMAGKSTPQAIFDDGLSENVPNGVSGDDFFVDGLLDFSNEDEDVEEEEEKDCVSVSSQEQVENDISNSTSLSTIDEFGSVPDSELCVPGDDLADLEWLSHFVEDSSFTEFSLPSPAGNQTEKIQIHTEKRSEPETNTAVPKRPCLLTRVPVKARSKRSRTGGRVWSLGLPPLTESSSTSSSSSSSSSSTSCLVFANAGQNLELFYCLGKPSAYKQKKEPMTESGFTQPQRRCSHCHVQKTPQWRTGPLGAKTLCNACGVRYKSGRLLPEYRPALSPTFSGDIHSNNHRKVLEMRKRKEITRPDSGFTPAVHSF
ncbi:hypothetical protein HHK36_010219 [Tetracentron sinense]|uniref:GATA transcription factor n=1 Tax=Tetracentron sinense TaxID=13715 RepID=A0A834ZGJ4_TETSI|nr:hypothetical protein HHK36_010219 [Tetracentron sinense]